MTHDRLVVEYSPNPDYFICVGALLRIDSIYRLFTVLYVLPYTIHRFLYELGINSFIHTYLDLVFISFC